MPANVEEMAFVGQTPWHGLGRQLTEDASIDVWRTEAGLDWSVERAPVLFNQSLFGVSENVVPFEGREVLFRNDNRKPLAVVSRDYKVVQPDQILEFYRDLVGVGGMKLHTAGVLAEGKRIWALAKMDADFTLRGGDRLDGYLLLATSFDGTLATIGKFTSIRVVCQNTLNLAVYNSDGSTRPCVKVPHFVDFKPESVKQELGLGFDAWKAFQENIEVLAARKVNREETKQWLIDTFGDEEKTEAEQENGRIFKAVHEWIGKSPGAELDSAKNTAWGLVNGATYFIDHARKTRTADSRLNKAWFGDGAVLKQKAYENAMALAA